MYLKDRLGERIHVQVTVEHMGICSTSTCSGNEGEIARHECRILPGNEKDVVDIEREAICPCNNLQRIFRLDTCLESR